MKILALSSQVVMLVFFAYGCNGCGQMAAEEGGICEQASDCAEGMWCLGGICQKAPARVSEAQGGNEDAGTSDAGTLDTEPSDAASADVSEDVRTPDVEWPDGGGDRGDAETDAGSEVEDASVADANTDADLPDTWTDGGVETEDASVPDAGTPDVGGDSDPTDVGTPDAGITDTGTDAGCAPVCAGKCAGPDGCGGTCPDNCSAPLTCGGGETVNVCGCTYEGDLAFCGRSGKNCDDVTAADNCGTQKTVNCGTCTLPKTCGGGGTPNVCAKPPGNHLWSKRFGSDFDEHVYSVSADTTGNVFITGYFKGTVDFGGGGLTSAGGYDIFMAKYDAAGNYLWSKRFGFVNDDFGYSVSADASGNVFVTGELNYEIFLAKYDAAGNQLWSKSFGAGGFRDNYGESVSADTTGNVFVTGGFYGTVDFGGGGLNSEGSYDIFLAKFDAAGNHLWSKRFGASMGDYGESVSADGSGNVFVTGDFSGTVDFGGGGLTALAGDMFLAKYDAAGNHLWSKRFGYFGAGSEHSASVSADSSGNVFVTGDFDMRVDFGGGELTSAGSADIFLAKYDAAGNHLWSKRFGAWGYDYGYSVSADSTGNVFVTGRFQGTVDFGGGGLTALAGDMFLAKFDAAGNHLWSKRFGSAGWDDGRAVSADSSGNVLMTGQFEETVDFGGGGLTSAGGVDIFVGKYEP
jgi:hypothetical protein